MAADPHAVPVFELKSAVMTLVSVVLGSADAAALARALEARFGQTPHLFDREPVVLDLAPLADADRPVDFKALIALLQRYGMLPIAARGGSAAQMEAAQAAGLTEAPQPVHARAPAPSAAPPSPAPSSGEAAPATEAPQSPAPAGALLIDRPLRSGQQVYARGRDLVVLASVNFGAEVIADGSIHVYAPLRGRAIAGARGDTEARIYSTCLEAQLIAIAGTYRTAENPLPDEVRGQPAQVRLEGDRLLIEPLEN